MTNPAGDPVSFLDTCNSAAQSTNAMDTQINVPASASAVSEGRIPDGDYPSRAVTPVLHSTFSRASPFSQFLHRTEGNEPNYKTEQQSHR